MTDPRIHPIILSGGAGTRLWPLSREAYPKQLIALIGEETMLQQTLRRVVDPDRFAPPVIICNAEHRFMVAEQARRIGVDPAAILLEPEGRNTGPAIAAAAGWIVQTVPEAIALALPSDHLVRDIDAFRGALDRVAPAVRAGKLACFGIAPAGPETGFGYIRAGAEAAPGVFAIDRFVEKPDRPTAEAMLAQGGHSWNAGMFVFRIDRMLAEYARHDPDGAQAAADAVATAETTFDFLRLGAAFGAAPATPFDRAVMERTDAAVVAPVAMGWSDLGSWDALWAAEMRDAQGVTARGGVTAIDCTDSLLRAAPDSPMIAAIGLRDLVVVSTPDAVLVAHRDRAQDVKAVVDVLKREGRPQAREHPRVHRPWGYYQTVDLGERYQVKRLMVKPEAELSLQMHHHRAEHWVVVRGTARVTRDEDERLVYENQSIYIPSGAKHRLANPGKIALHLIEVQSGAYLGEDDIVRFEDVYARV